MSSIMNSTHHNHGHQPHGHQHHGENSEDYDPGALYSHEWVQDGVRKIQGFIRTNVPWLGTDTSASQRVLDYACGHGTISIALASECPHTIFRGLDSHPKQVARYNDEAAKLFGEDNDQMRAIQGDLSNPSSDLDQADWSNFDVAIISLALHHVSEPIEMLSQLRKRLRPGGALIVVEMYEDDEEERITESDKLNREGMVVVHGREKIWAGFSPRGLVDLLKTAEFTNTDVRKPDLLIQVPDTVGDSSSFCMKKLMFVKGINGAVSAL